MDLNGNLNFVIAINATFCTEYEIDVNPLAYVPDINVGDIENTRVLDYSESKEASE